ncbi:MAG TPA: cytochrome c biogenesis protein CcsA [Ktedonobacterales bacterium]|jgi:heme exporter protein C|nr:cytochrome c biogenesis protein CcsA [Ktedonobacterales bacterium]
MNTLASDPAKSGQQESSKPLGKGLLDPVRRYGEYVLGGALAIGMLVSIWAAFLGTPTDAVQGDVQRIMYFHVPMALLAFFAFFVVFVASIVYLLRRDERWDWLARASAEVGVVYTTMVLICGSIWGKAYWGTWWDGEPILTTTLILWFIYVAYLLLRFYSGRTESGARNAAVLGIIGFVDVPIVHFAVTWWRGLHPTGYVLNGATPDTPASVFLALLLAMATFTLLYAFLLLQLYRLERYTTEAERLRAQVEYGDDSAS